MDKIWIKGHGRHFHVCFFRAHIRLWDTDTLETHCVLGLGEYELRADAVAFSSSVDGDILLCGK